MAGAALFTLAAVADDNARRPRRRVTPVNNQATATQAINETRGDTARINAARRASSTLYYREDGAIVYVDTVTGEEWIDSAAIRTQPRMKFPLLCGISVGVNIWDPAMRLFGQKHGLIGFTADVSLYNRFFPALEIGLGTAKNTADIGGYTYRSPISPYFKLGLDYNFLYNSNPDYKFFAGLRYGFSPYTWAVDNITLDSPYWDEAIHFNLPGQNATAGWLEFGIGLRIKLSGNISAGWTAKIHTMLHESASKHGEPWYIPGYGTRGQAITGSFTITYTLPINRKAIEAALLPDDERPDTLATAGDTIVGPGLIVEKDSTSLK